MPELEDLSRLISSDKEYAILSIAVSLKRIADTLDLQQIGAMLAVVISRGIQEALVGRG